MVHVPSDSFSLRADSLSALSEGRSKCFQGDCAFPQEFLNQTWQLAPSSGSFVLVTVVTMVVGGKVSFSEAWPGRDFPEKPNSFLNCSVHTHWPSISRRSRGSLSLKRWHDLEVNSPKALYFPKFPGKLTSHLHISVAFPSVWKVSPTLL